MKKEILATEEREAENIAAADETAIEGENAPDTEGGSEKAAPGSGEEAAEPTNLYDYVVQCIQRSLAEAGALSDRENAGEARLGRAGVTGGANPPPRLAEDDFLRGFKEI